MDSIFQEDSGELGSEIEAYCPSPRCKANTTHTIVSMYEEEIRRVKCVVCDDTHSYQKPREDGAEDADLVPKKRALPKPSWTDAMTKSTDADLNGCRTYSVRDTYEEGDFVLHPLFEVGVITESLPDNKLEVIFRDGFRVLVHNRTDLASRMPGLSEQPTPRDVRKKRPNGREELPDAPLRTVAQAIELAKAAAMRKNDGGKAPRGKGTVPPPAPAVSKTGKGTVPPPKGAPAKAAPAIAAPGAKTKAVAASKPVAKPAAKPASGKKVAPTKSVAVAKKTAVAKPPKAAPAKPAKKSNAKAKAAPAKAVPKKKAAPAKPTKKPTIKVTAKTTPKKKAAPAKPAKKPAKGKKR